MDFDPTGLEVAPAWAEHILDAWVCGSAARSDLDSESDLDVTVVVADDLSVDPKGDPVVAGGLTLPIDASIYTLSGFGSLVQPPSLFAWHLVLEGRLLTWPGPAAAMLETLEPFCDHREDLRVLHRLAQEAAESLLGGSPSLVFEFGVLATAVRNAALVVTHFDGAPDFSRSAPAILVDHHQVPLPVTLEVYLRMSRARKAGEGVGAAPPVPRALAENVGGAVVQWLADCMDYVEMRT